MARNEIFKLIPFGIAAVLVIISIIQVLMMPNSVNEKGSVVQYVISEPIIYASFGLIIVLVFIILRKNYWKHAFGILLIIAFSPLIQFYRSTFSFGIGVIQIELTTLALLILHLALNSEVLRDTLVIFTSNETNNEEIKESKNEDYIKK